MTLLQATFNNSQLKFDLIIFSIMFHWHKHQHDIVSLLADGYKALPVRISGYNQVAGSESP